MYVYLIFSTFEKKIHDLTTPPASGEWVISLPIPENETPCQKGLAGHAVNCVFCHGKMDHQKAQEKGTVQ